MRVLIYSDPHITKYPQGLAEIRKTETVALFEEMYSNKDIDYAICLGDFFHTSQILAKDVPYILNVVSKITIPTFILTGNHDRSSDSDSILNLLPKINDKICVVSTFDTFEDFILCSYGYLNKMDIDLDHSEYKYLCTHEDYRDVRMKVRGRKSTTGYDRTLFSGQIFNGHIHLKSDEGNLTNVGSISPIAYGELELGRVPTYEILDTDIGVSQVVEVTRGLIPWTCKESDIPTLIVPANIKVMLRIEYEGDKPEYELSDNIVAIDYKKILPVISDIDVSDIEQEDTVVQVPESVELLVNSDTSLSDESKLSVLSTSREILKKVGN